MMTKAIHGVISVSNANRTQGKPIDLKSEGVKIVTVIELIRELNKYPSDKRVDLTSLTTTLGEVKRAIEYDDYIELETDED
jgi:hypothetical protein